MRDELGRCEDLIMQEIQQGEWVNLQKFTDIVDLFFYLPMQKPHTNNDSSNLYYVLSSNTEGSCC